jgi:glycosyltransferase involved in cell wall biosynthesis
LFKENSVWDLKILHITSWFPNLENEKEALFIQRQIDSLEPYVEFQKVVHLNVTPGPFRSDFTHHAGVTHYILSLPISRWFVIEIISSILLIWILFRHSSYRFTLINFHIAYPNLTHWHLIGKLLSSSKVVISEHWSAYHSNFGLDRPPSRIVKIFSQGIPVLAVSSALSDDIKKFSNADLISHVVPNVVDTDFFLRDEHIEREDKRFFMVGQWQYPKMPLVAIHAFHRYLNNYPDGKLVIAGYGSLLSKMKSLVSELKLNSSVIWFEKMSSLEISREMNKASAYIHISSYETFSVVCAEAIHCKCPVIASRVGGIPEFINERNGVLVSENLEKCFFEAMLKITEEPILVENEVDFSKTAIGLRYIQVLRELLL